MNIKELIKGNFVKFDNYRQGIFYYNIMHFRESGEDADKYDVNLDAYYDLYQFPVPSDDIGTATLLSEDKAITFMRWIRKAIEDKTLIKI